MNFSPKMVGMAVLGCGRIGRMHARNLARHPRAKLVMVFDVLPEAAQQTARELDVKIARSVDEVLSAADVGGVLVATPTDTHVPLIMAAVRAGKAGLCEKPVDLELAVITSRDPAPPAATYIKASGGLMRDMTIHDFDMARYLAGDIAQVHAFGANLVDPAIGKLGDIDTCTISLRARAGALIQINNSRRCVYGYDQRIEAFGSNGMLQAGNQYATSVESWGAEHTGAREPVLHFFIERYRQAYTSEVDSFVSSLEQGRPMSPDFGDGLQALRLAVAADESLRTGQVVEL